MLTLIICGIQNISIVLSLKSIQISMFSIFPLSEVANYGIIHQFIWMDFFLHYSITRCNISMDLYQKVLWRFRLNCILLYSRNIFRSYISCHILIFLQAQNAPIISKGKRHQGPRLSCLLNFYVVVICFVDLNTHTHTNTHTYTWVREVLSFQNFFVTTVKRNIKNRRK